MRCGKCRESHDTVAQVRACYGQKTTPPTSALPKIHEAPPKNRFAGKCHLCGSYVGVEGGHIKKIDDKWQVFHNEGECLENVLVGSASDVEEQILMGRTFLAEKPRTAKGKELDEERIPQGYYATTRKNSKEVDFWYVKWGKNRWEGYNFVSRVLGGSPNVSVGKEQAFKALETIRAQGIDQAGNLFGKRMRQCRWCRKSLTKYASRMLSAGRQCCYSHGIGELWDQYQAEAPEEEAAS